jgi:hypothetical protein
MKNKPELSLVKLSNKRDKIWSKVAYWRYAKVEKVYKSKGQPDYHYWHVHEVYCDKKDRAIFICEEPEILQGETTRELILTLNMIKKDMIKYRPIRWKEYQKLIGGKKRGTHGRSKQNNPA